jgi:hypothetical protein
MILFGIIDRLSMARYMKAYFWFYVHLDLSPPFLTGMPVPAVAGTGWMAVLSTFGYPSRLMSSLTGADGGLFAFFQQCGVREKYLFCHWTKLWQALQEVSRRVVSQPVSHMYLPIGPASAEHGF